MSVAYFPEIYEDELVYSVLARFYVHGGYPHFKDAGKELFCRVQDRVDKEFVKWLKPEIVELLTRHMTFEELLEKHTMYPAYGRFIDSDRRNKAFQALMSMEGDFVKLLGVPQPRKGECRHRYMRYCPLCVTDDRKKYGETYWHRIHQIMDINLCAVHGCYLANSDVSLESRGYVCLVSAEESLPLGDELQKEIAYSPYPVEIKLSQYTVKVFQQPLDRNNTVFVKDFLHSGMAGTPYLSLRGEHKYFHKLWEDMKLFYQGVSVMDIITDGHIQRLLNGDRISVTEICMVAMFLGISAEELSAMETPTKTPEQQFDEKVKTLLDSGMIVNAVAKEMGVAFGIVKMSIDISEKGDRAKGYAAGRKRTKRDMNYWEELDKKMLPIVRQTVTEMLNNGTNRPQRISISAVSKKLDIPVYRIANMNQCKMEIEQYAESRKQYRARKVIWAVETLQRENKPLIGWRICSIAKIEKDELISFLPYLEKKHPDLYEAVLALM